MPKTLGRKRALVTGGAGFIGSHLCDALLEQGFDVLSVDNFFTGTRDNVAHLLGNPQEFSMLELAEKVISQTGSKSKIVFKPLPSDDPTQRCPDIALARQSLAWEPTVPLTDGLQRTIAYFRQALAR